MKIKKPSSTKKFHLTLSSIETKIEKLTTKLATLSGPENSTKRKNLFFLVSKLKKAKTDPLNVTRNPEAKKSKGETDRLRRISKKLLKKKEEMETKRREKNKDRKKNCLFCKKFGHTIQDCTEREKQGIDIRICYKCGSNEHNLDDCPKYDEIEGFPHVTCFICKEIGHLSKDCKDAKNGIFYKGGGCYFCGSNQHKKMDCPNMNINSGKQQRYDYNFEDEE